MISARFDGQMVALENWFVLRFTLHGRHYRLQEVYGYRRNALRTGISWFFIFLTLGALRLVFHWWPHLMLLATHHYCPLHCAEKLLIVVSIHRNQYYQYLLLIFCAGVLYKVRSVRSPYQKHHYSP